MAKMTNPTGESPYVAAFSSSSDGGRAWKGSRAESLMDRSHLNFLKNATISAVTDRFKER
jgi:hypothetical protein